MWQSALNWGSQILRLRPSTASAQDDKLRGWESAFVRRRVRFVLDGLGMQAGWAGGGFFVRWGRKRCG